MHLSACSNNSRVSAPMGSVLSLPACIFGKIKRALAVDRGKCQAFLQAWTHNRFTSFNSLSDRSMSAAEKRKAPILLFVNNSVASSGARGWHLIRSRAAMIFSGHVLQ